MKLRQKHKLAAPRLYHSLFPFLHSRLQPMPRQFRSAWLKTLATVAVLLLSALLIGTLLGHPTLVVALAALGVLAWHYWRLRQVLTKLNSLPE